MINGTAEQFQKFAADYNNMMMDSWSSFTKQTIQSDAFTSASGAFMDWSLATHKMMTELSGQVMESMDIPKRSDLARLSAQVQAVESRLLNQEDNQEEIRDLLTTLIKKIDQMPKGAPAQPVAEPVKTEPVKAEASKSEEKAMEEAPVEKPVAKKTATKKSRKKSK